MFDMDIAGMDATETLDSAARMHDLRTHADLQLLRLGQHFADLFPDPATLPGHEAVPGGERGHVYGGPGCPAVAEFAAAEFGAVIGRSAGSAAILMGQALALRHRLVHLWAQVESGHAEPWKACTVATACLTLSMEAAAIVDRRVARIINTVTPAQLEKIVKAAVWQADPEAARAEADRRAKERGVWVGRTDDHGTTSLHIRAATGAVFRLKTTLRRIADVLADLGDTGTLQERLARAVEIISDPALTHQLLTIAHHLTKTTPTSSDTATTSAAPETTPSTSDAHADPAPTPYADTISTADTTSTADATSAPSDAPTASTTSAPAPSDAATAAAVTTPSTSDTYAEPAPTTSATGTASTRPSTADAGVTTSSTSDARPDPTPTPSAGASASTSTASATTPSTPDAHADSAPTPSPSAAASIRTSSADAGATTPSTSDAHADLAPTPSPSAAASDAVPSSATATAGSQVWFTGDEPSDDDEADRDPPHPSHPIYDCDPPASTWPPRDPSGGDTEPEPAEEAGPVMDDAALRELRRKLAAIRHDAYSTGIGATGHRPAPTTVYVHITDQTLLAGGGVTRVERFGPVFAARLEELLGHTQIIIKPVIDLNEKLNVNAYEIPRRIREHLKLTHPVEQFPYGAAETTNSTDLDHIQPYNFQATGPPGQTSTTNLAPLRRYSHRVKTHGDWTVKRLNDGTLEWTTKHGYKFHVNHTGTHRIHPETGPSGS